VSADEEDAEQLKVFWPIMIEKEKALIDGCLRSDKTAWDAFVRQYSNLVYYTIKKTLVRHHTDACTDVVEDLYQEFFVSLLRNECKKLRQFRGAHGCSLASWLRIVTTRLTIDFVRKQALPSGEVANAMYRDSPDPAEPLINEEQEKLLNQAVQSLPARDRILLDLCYRQVLTSDEVAEHLKTSVNAVYAQKSRVLEKIREVLRRSGAL
jgi:RNA polymerase sigma factor (sigma-70 family)